jgi:hypothetical protein
VPYERGSRASRETAAGLAFPNPIANLQCAWSGIRKESSASDKATIRAIYESETPRGASSALGRVLVDSTSQMLERRRFLGAPRQPSLYFVEAFVDGLAKRE